MTATRTRSRPGRILPRNASVGLAAAALGAGPGPAGAQPGATPADPMAPTVERRPDAVVDTSSLGMLWIQRLDGMTLGVNRARALPEGTGVINRDGRVLLAGDRWVFLPDRDQPAAEGDGGATARATIDGPVLLMPNRLLQSVLASVREQGNEARYRVSGRVTLYRGINALQLAAATPVFVAPDPPSEPSDQTAAETGAETGPESGSDPTEPPGPAGATRPGGSDPLGADDPSVQDLLNRLDALPGLGNPRTGPPGSAQDTPGAPTRRRPGPASARGGQADDGSAPPPGAAVDGLRDGDLMSRRTGRLTRTPAGRWAFTIDQGVGALAGAGGAGLGLDRAFTIQPGTALEQLEGVALQRGDGVRVEMSGRVMTFEDSAYVLPTVYRVLPKADLDPMG